MQSTASAFQEFPLQPAVIQALKTMGLESPTPIQHSAWGVLMLEPQDLIAISPTGTGKTLAYGIPMIHQVGEPSASFQGLVLCPTREL